ncbi:MAG: sulfatase-like hydrolase/transferase [Marinilabiliaceae bacterium]|nr:sulfatase-like hydrolase/transferase [Marinilabiliaceae bacterium]
MFSDDAGYADFSMNGSITSKTPHIDAIANNGMTFTNGYVSGSVCSPSRAGLLTGRYQQRFGHECNLGDNYANTDDALLGIPVSEITLASILKREGYKTGMIEKWHLGEEKQFYPCNRGFDDFFGMLGGGSLYLPGKATNIIRNYTKVDYLSLPYLTDTFGDEACMFIEKNMANPFFWLFLKKDG